MIISKIVYMVDHFIEDPLVKAWKKSSDVVYAFIGINI